MSLISVARSAACACVVSSAVFGVSPLAVSAAQTAWDPTATKALPLKSSVATRALAAATPLHVVVSLKLRDADGLKAFIRNQHTPGNPQYGVMLTPAQFAAAYGPSPSTAQSVAAYLKAQGFRNVRIAPNRVLVTADGSAALAQAAFNTSLKQFDFNGKNVFVPVTDVMAPSALNGAVLAVLGLSSLPHAYPDTRKRAAADEFRGGIVRNASGTPALVDAYTPAQTRQAYNVGVTPSGVGTTIAISTSGSDLSQVIADLRQSETVNNLPQVPVKVVQTAPLPEPQDTAGDGEWDLDSQTSTGIASGVQQLIFYNATDLGDSLLTAYNQFATDNLAKAGNMSYGGCELLQTGFIASSDQAFMQAVAQGQTWFASSGDAGSACSLLVNYVTPLLGIPGAVEYPASSPYVVAVGGTTLLTNTDGDYYFETSWDAGGGGTSLVESAPDWQSAQVPGALLGLRGVPDVAMVAGGPDVGTPVGFFGFGAAAITFNGASSAAVGTSWSSPLAVGVWARLQSARCNTLGFAAPVLYALDTAPGLLSKATGFHDTLLGTNGLFVATPGWDYTTGYGSFDIAAVNAALPAPPAGCDTNVAPPTAALSASEKIGPAPFSVGFDGSASSDPAALAITSYSIDFGDGSYASQDSPTFPPHAYAIPGTYTARLTVANAKGGYSTAASQTITAFGTPPGCAVGGELMLSSPPGVADAVNGIDLGGGTDDLLSTSISEPVELDGKLVFTTKVDNLTRIRPGFRWVTYFDVAGRDRPNDQYYYVAMVTATSLKPKFYFGTHGFLPGPEPLSTFKVLGTLDAASNANADGTITLVLDKAALNPKPGDVLTQIFTSIRISTPDDPTGHLGLGVGLTQDAAGSLLNYTIVGNPACGANAAPTARFTAAPGPLSSSPLALDASSSSDPDAIDHVAYFRFDYGDGGQPLWSDVPQAQHRYAAPGTYTVQLQVADSRGLIGGNVASKQVAIGDLTPDPFSFAPRTAVALDADVYSNVVTIHGIDGPAPVSVSAGSYAINGGTYTIGAGTISNGDTVRIKLHTPNAVKTSTSASLSVGTVSAVFTVTTRATDATPDAISFGSLRGVPTNTVVTSTTATVSGLDAGISAPVSVSNGQYRINNGAWTAAAGQVVNGDLLQLTQVSGARGGVTVVTRLRVGPVAASFASTTDPKAAVDPSPLSFTGVSNAIGGRAYISNSVTPSGYNSPAALSVTGGALYRINNGSWSSASTVIHPGDMLTLRVISSATPGASVHVIVRIGNTEGGFLVQTRN